MERDEMVMDGLEDIERREMEWILLSIPFHGFSLLSIFQSLFLKWENEEDGGNDTLEWRRLEWKGMDRWNRIMPFSEWDVCCVRVLYWMWMVIFERVEDRSENEKEKDMNSEWERGSIPWWFYIVNYSYLWNGEEKRQVFSYSWHDSSSFIPFHSNSSSLAHYKRGGGHNWGCVIVVYLFHSTPSLSYPFFFSSLLLLLFPLRHCSIREEIWNLIHLSNLSPI